jgi:UvrD/REP helicase N-terminal domain
MNVELSAPQRAAVDFPWDEDGRTTMVVATAGSGKTMTLALRALRIARELHAAGRTSESVLCVCFGMDARNELCSRIEGLILDAGVAGHIVCPGSYPGVDVTRVFILVKSLFAQGLLVLRLCARTVSVLTVGSLALCVPLCHLSYSLVGLLHYKASSDKGRTSALV